MPRKAKSNMGHALYLNNCGDKWIVVDHNYSRAPMDFMLVLPDGTAKKRRADYYESFGNFATVEFRLNGLRYGGFFSSFERIDDLPVLRRYSRRYSKAECDLIQSIENGIRNGKEIDENAIEMYMELMQNRIINVSESE